MMTIVNNLENKVAVPGSAICILSRSVPVFS